MPTRTDVNMFYLGRYDQIDTNENNQSSERAADLLGDYGTPRIQEVREIDRDDDGVIHDDEMGSSGNDHYRYDLGDGNGAGRQYLDSTTSYTARLTLADGSVREVTVAVLQMQNGDTFVRDTGNALDGLDIQQFELVAVHNDSYSGAYTGQSIENTQPVCFARGTLLETATGPRRVERVAVGDLLRCADGTVARAAWLARCTLPRPGAHAPVRIAAGALGPARPARTLRVSPQHRIALRSRLITHLTGEAGVLVAAKALVGLPGITRASPKRAIDYIHIACAAHVLLVAEGIETESFWPGPQALQMLTAADRAALAVAVPDLFAAAKLGTGASALPVIRGPARKQVIARLVRSFGAVTRRPVWENCIPDHVPAYTSPRPQVSP